MKPHHVLVLIDNTASMGRTTEFGLPFLTFAKSTVYTLRTEFDRQRIKSDLLVAIGDHSGKPIVFNFSYDKKESINYINNLEISPLAKIEEIMYKGLIEFNKLRFSLEADLTEPFFFPKLDVFSIYIISDFVSIPPLFFQKTLQYNDYEEYLFRADENINFFSINPRPNYPQPLSCPNDHEFFSILDINSKLITRAYDVVSEVQFNINSSSSQFHFILNFPECPQDSQLKSGDHKNTTSIHAKISIQKQCNWPLPYQYWLSKNHNFSIYPTYQCIPTTKSVNSIILSDEYPIVTRGPLPSGTFDLTYPPDTHPFGRLLSNVDGKTSIIIYPYNFYELNFNPIPSMGELEMYLASIPYVYIDSVLNFIKSINITLRSNGKWNTASTQKKLMDRKKNERQTMFQLNQASQSESSSKYIIIDPSMPTSLISDLVEQVDVSTTCVPWRIQQSNILFIHNDTADDVLWTSSHSFKREPSFSIFKRDLSPLSEENLKSLLNRYQKSIKTSSSIGENAKISANSKNTVSNIQETNGAKIDKTLEKNTSIKTISNEKIENNIERKTSDKNETSFVTEIEKLTIELRNKNFQEAERLLKSLLLQSKITNEVKRVVKKIVSRFGLESSLSSSFQSLLK